MLRERIDEMVLIDASLEEIEREVIEPAPVTEDVASALWLYAWGCLERQRTLLPA